MRYFFKEVSIAILKSKNRHHRGEFRVSYMKFSLGFGREIEHVFLKTEKEVQEFINNKIIEYMKWLE